MNLEFLEIINHFYKELNLLTNKAISQMHIKLFHEYLTQEQTYTFHKRIKSSSESYRLAENFNHFYDEKMNNLCNLLTTLIDHCFNNAVFDMVYAAK